MEQRDPVEAVLITGTTGSGKTALAIDMGHVLAANDLSAAIIDLDWLGWMTAPPRQDGALDRLIVKNLAAVIPNFLDAGVRLIVLVRSVGDRSMIGELAPAMGTAGMTVIRVTASEDTTARRLRTRDTGAELEEHLLQASDLSKLLDEIGVEDFAVANEGRPIREVSVEVLSRLGWVQPA